MFPYMTPYFMQRWIHLEHHARLNEREDPNFVYIDGPFWKIPLRYPRALGYARKLLTRDPRRPGERHLGRRLGRRGRRASSRSPGGSACCATLLWLWLVPVVIAKLVMDWYINYLPHVGLPPRSLPGHAHRRSALAHAARARAQLPRHPSPVAHDPVARLPSGVPGEARLPEGAWRSDRTRDRRHRTPTGHGLCEPRSRLVETRCALCGSGDAEIAASGFDFEYDTAPNEFRFLRCRACAHVYLSPRPPASDLSVIYPPNYYAFAGPGNPLVARLRRRWEAGKVRLYRELVGPGPRRLLDVGCGNGRFLSLLRDFGAPEWQLVGIDFDEAAVAQLPRARIRGARRADRGSPGRAKASFDAVIMLQLIEHVEDPVAICASGAPAAAARGRLRDRDAEPGRPRLSAVPGPLVGPLPLPAPLEPLLDGVAAAHARARAGFEIVRSEYLISTSSWTISLHNYLLDRGWPAADRALLPLPEPAAARRSSCVFDSLRARLGLETSNQRVIASKPV